VVHPASYKMGTGSFPRVKQPVDGVDRPPPSSAEVKERTDLCRYSPLWAFVACSRVSFTFTVTFTLYSATITTFYTLSSLRFQECAFLSQNANRNRNTRSFLHSQF